MSLSVAQLERLRDLAKRSHHGVVDIREIEDANGLDWVEAVVSLTDMGKARPLHTFYIGPTGNLKGAILSS